MNTWLKILDRVFDSEVGIKITDEGWKIRQADKSAVCLMDLSIPKEKFLEYSLKGEEFGFAIKIGDMKDFLGKLSSGVEMKIDNNEGIMKLEGSQIEFELPLFEKTNEDMETEDMEWESKLNIEVKSLGSLLENAGMVADSFLFEKEGSKLIVKNEEDKKSFKKTLFADRENPDIEWINKSAEDFEVRFPHDYWNRIIRNLSQVESELEISLQEEFPAKIEGKNFKYIIAPRISDE